MKVYRAMESNRTPVDPSSFNVMAGGLNSEIFVTDSELAAIGWAIALELASPVVFEIEVPFVLVWDDKFADRRAGTVFPAAHCGIDGVALTQATVPVASIIGFVQV